MVYRLLIFTLLMAIWLVFSGFFDGFHITLGVISAVLVTWLSADLLFENRSTRLSARLVQAGRMTSYLGWLIWQVVLSNIQIWKLAMSPSGVRQVKPRILKFSTSLESDFEKFLLANSITLTPGTITIKILGDEFYVHAINEKAAEGLDGEMERRIAAIFAPDRDNATQSNPGPESRVG